MVQIDGYNLKISKGDTLSLSVAFTGSLLPQGTSILFTVRANPGDREAVLEKTYTPDESGSILVYLSGKETGMATGRYVWDLRAILPDGVVATPFAPAAFEIVEVVGDVC